MFMFENGNVSFKTYSKFSLCQMITISVFLKICNKVLHICFFTFLFLKTGIIQIWCFTRILLATESCFVNNNTILKGYQKNLESKFWSSSKILLFKTDELLYCNKNAITIPTRIVLLLINIFEDQKQHQKIQKSKF